MPDRIVVALEAPSYSGKSTLSRELQKRLTHDLVVLPDYMHVPTDDKKPTAPAPNATTQWESLLYFMSLDATRTLRARSQNPRAKVELLDRSIHTLLAHIYAMERLRGWAQFSDALTAAYADPLVSWPEVIVYLDASQDLLTSRYGSRGESSGEELFTNAEYNVCFREYFFPTPHCPPSHNHRFIVLDAKEPTEVLADAVIPVMRETLGRLEATNDAG